MCIRTVAFYLVNLENEFLFVELQEWGNERGRDIDSHDAFLVRVLSNDSVAEQALIHRLRTAARKSEREREMNICTAKKH